MKLPEVSILKFNLRLVRVDWGRSAIHGGIIRQLFQLFVVVHFPMQTVDSWWVPFIALVAVKQTTHENKIKTGRRCVCVCVSNGSGGKKTPRKIGKGEIVQVNDPFPSIFIERIYNLWQENCLVAEYLAATTEQTTLRCSARASSCEKRAEYHRVAIAFSFLFLCVSLASTDPTLSWWIFGWHEK